MLSLNVVGTGLEIHAWQFALIFLLIFGLFLILAGAFTAYFGSGKSRTIGVALLVVGLVVGFGMALFYHSQSPGDHDMISLGTVFWQSLLVILAAGLGALAAIAIFLVAIMKS
jgi:hypothetical protein